MSEVLSKLGLLNDKEVAKVLKLINKLAAKHEVEETVGEDETVVTSRPAKSTLKEEYGVTSRPAKNAGGRASKIRTRPGKEDKGVQARAEPPYTGNRKNQLFELLGQTSIQQELRQESKNDANIEKHIHRPPPVPRGLRKAEKVWMECTGSCGQEYLVDPGLVTSQYSFKCNDCISGR